MGAEGQPWSRSLKIRASHLWIWISSLLLAAQVLTAQVGWSQMDIAGAPPGRPKHEGRPLLPDPGDLPRGRHGPVHAQRRHPGGV